MPTLSGKTNDIVHNHLNIDMTEEERCNHMPHIFMTKYTLSIVIKKFKKQGETEVTKELNQINTLETFAPVDATKQNKK